MSGTWDSLSFELRTINISKTISFSSIAIDEECQHVKKLVQWCRIIQHIICRYFFFFSLPNWFFTSMNLRAHLKKNKKNQSYEFICAVRFTYYLRYLIWIQGNKTIRAYAQCVFVVCPPFFFSAHLIDWHVVEEKYAVNYS